MCVARNSLALNATLKNRKKPKTMKNSRLKNYVTISLSLVGTAGATVVVTVSATLSPTFLSHEKTGGSLRPKDHQIIKIIRSGN
jgi:hypothetical protein